MTWREQLNVVRTDIAFAMRQFRKNPAFAAAALFTMSLGIGANAAIYSAVHHLLLAPLPYHEVNRVVLVVRTILSTGMAVEPRVEVSHAVRDRAHSFESASLYARASFTLTTPEGPELLDGANLDPGILRTVGMQPVLGRGFVPDDTLSGAPDVVLISYGTWQTKFGGAPGVVGRTMRIDERPSMVIGVMPANFTLPWTNGDQLWMPLKSLVPGSAADVIARLTPQVSVQAANREVGAIVADDERATSKAGSALGTAVMPAVDFLNLGARQSGIRTALLVLLAATGLVLLIACANIANLLLARAWTRQREFALRIALGATRRRIGAQLLIESVLLALMGGALGLLFAWRGLDVLLAMRPATMPELSNVHLDMAVLAWSAAVALGVGILFGLAPALLASGRRTGSALQSDGRGSAGSGRSSRFHSTLVGAEVALSTILLVGAGLLFRSFIALRQVDTGIDPKGLVALQLEFPHEPFSRASVRAASQDRIILGVQHLPGVQRAALALVAPPSSALWAGGDIEVDGEPIGLAERSPVFGVNLTTPQFFALAGMSPKRGRVFETASSDTNALNPHDVVVSETFARQHWPHGNALGGRVRAASGGPWMTVVGIVGDMRLPGKFDVSKDAQLYQPMPYGFASPRLLVRSREPVARIVPQIIAAIATADPDVRVRRVTTAEGTLALATASPRFVAMLLGTFAAVALLLAAVGLYGVIAYSVRQRTREIGIRIALGAQPHRVLAHAVGRGLAFAAIGLAVGLLGALLCARVLRSMLFGVRPFDAVIMLTAVGCITATTAVAAFLPARRAVRVDPVEALRAE